MGWLSGWTYRKKHEINGSTAGAVTDYQMRFKVHYGSGTDSGEDVYLNSKCRSDFGDVRFTKDDGTTVLDYWMEEKVDGDYAIFWVKVPSIPADPDKATIYIYYGKSDATYAGSGTDTFIFYDDFETWEGWTQHGSGEVSQDSARAFEGTYSAHKTTANDPNGAYKSIGQTLGRNIALEFRVNRNSGYSGGPADRIGLLNAGDDGYGWGYRHNYDELYIDKRTDYSGTQYGFVSATDEMDAWVKGILKIYGDTIKAERYLSNGTKAGETSLTDTDYTDFNRVYIFGGYDYWVDQMFIRSYVDPEPSHGTWYAAEAYQELSEVLSVGDVKVLSAYRIYEEVITLADVVSALRVLVKTLEETLALLDSLVKAVSATKVDVLSFSDLIQKTLSRPLSEALTLADVRLSKSILMREEALGLSDLISKASRLTRAETLALGDLLLKLVRIRAFLEQISMTPLVEKMSGKFFDELLSLQDLLTKLKVLIRELVEELNLAEGFYPFRMAVERRALSPYRKAEVRRRISPKRRILVTDEVKKAG